MNLEVKLLTDEEFEKTILRLDEKQMRATASPLKEGPLYYELSVDDIPEGVTKIAFFYRPS